MENCIPLPLDNKVLEEVVEISKDWALCNGIIMRTKQTKSSSEIINYAPHWLLPSPFPQKLFKFAKTLQKGFNELIHKVAHDHEFLVKSLENTIKVDEFTNKLFHIYSIVRKEGVSQPISFGFFRSDYLIDEDENFKMNLGIKLVEINTISVSFANLGSKIPLLHRHNLSQLGYDVDEKVPLSHCGDNLARSLILAWNYYNCKNAVILFVVEELVQNIFDQRILEFQIQSLEGQMKIIRRTFKSLQATAKLNDKVLFVDGMEVAVVYFRTGYTHIDFTSEKDWAVRLLLEQSKAIKCPTIPYQLAGTKKIQQELTLPGVLEKYLSDPEVIMNIRKTFVGIFSLDRNDEGNIALLKGIQNPEKYVLKPQREGGGNNVYGVEVQQTLTKLKDSDERTAYILMELISSPLAKNYFVRSNEEVLFCDVINELGIYGSIIGTPDKILENDECDYLLRTKMVQSNEAGVAAGYGGLDSVFLI